MGTLAANTTSNNGGFTSLGTKTYNYVIRGAEPPVQTRDITVASGQVLKKYTLLESDTSGNMIAHAPLVERASVVFAAIDAAETIILAGLTWTAGGSGTTAAQLAEMWADIPVGTAYDDALLVARATGGTFTAGTLTGYETYTSGTPLTTVIFRATTAATATDIADTGTGDNPTVTIIQYAAANKIVGLLAMDVDATDAAVKASAYISGNFWEDGIVWGIDVATDTIDKIDGTTRACTAYDTGCYNSALRQKLLENLAGGTNIVVGAFLDGEVE